jgi:hypothetical protein
MVTTGWSLVSLLLLALPIAVAAGCGSSSPPSSGTGGSGVGGAGGANASAGGPLPGAADSHCAAIPIVIVNPASCKATPEPGGDAEEPAVLFNAEGNDDDCKYRVSFTTTPLDAPVTGADPSIEGTQGEFHALPNNGTITAAGTAPGTYTIGPVKFDASGAWVTRFHLFEDCADVPESPHGHVAFYLYVP